ncbi:hypothetical protein QTP88_004325 [Uroleucon formosanum]
MDPNSKASIPNNGNPAKLIKQKVPPLVIKKNRLLSNHDDSNSPSPNSDDEFRSPRRTARARDLSPASSSFFPTQNRFSPLEIENSNQVSRKLDKRGFVASVIEIPHTRCMDNP